MAKGFVYILENSSFSALKIGQSSNHPENRAQDLYDTGVPTPYKVLGWLLVDKYDHLERLVHEDLAETRVNPKREFFNCSVATAVASIRKLAKEHGLDVEIDKLPAELNSADHANRGNRDITLSSLGIPEYKPSCPKIRVWTVCPVCRFKEERHIYKVANARPFCRCRSCGHEYRESISEMMRPR